MKNLTFLRSLFVLSALLIAGVGYAQISRDISKLKSLSSGKIIKLDKKAESLNGNRSHSQTMKKSGELRNDTVVFFHESFGNGDVGEGLEINSYSGYDSFNNGLGITGNGMIYGSGDNNYAWLPKATKNEEDGKYYINGFIDFDGIDFGSYSKVLLQFNIAKTGNNANIGIYTSDNGGTLSFDLPEANIFYIANPIDITNILSNGNTLLKLACTDTASVSDGIFIDEIKLLGVNQVKVPEPHFAEYVLASDSEPLIFEHSPLYPWSLQEENGIKGVYSTNKGIQSSSSWFSTTLTSDALIELSFDWKVSSEQCCDKLRLYINGEEYMQAENTGTYINQHLELSPGAYTLKWDYSKDGSRDNEEDCGYVRNLKIAYSLLEVNKEIIDFGNVNTPKVANDSVFISNVGKEELVITSIGEVATPFEVSALKRSTIGQGKGEYLYFVFAPSAEDKGLFTQVVTIESNRGQRQITLKGYANMGNAVEVSGYGQLSSIIPDTSVDSLVIIGYLNASDFSFLKNSMPNLKYLDMSMATVFENALPSSCFQNKRSLEEVILPESLRTINSCAFENCILLKSIILSEGLMNIYDSAFRNCSSLAGELFLPSTLQNIRYNAFQGTGYTICRSKAITPPNVSDRGSLGNISLVYVPKGSAQVYKDNYPWSEMAIIDGDSMTEVSVTLTEAGTLGAEILKQAESVAVVNKLTIAGPLNTTDWNLIRNSMSSLVSIDLSACTVTSIPHSQFSDKYSLLEVVLPSDLKIIEYDAFLRCTKLIEIIIPESVTSIGDNAFNGCTLLGKINIPVNLRSLGQSAFYGCTVLQSPIVIPEGIIEIPYNAFYNCRALSEVTLPESLLSIRNRAFYRCAIKNIVLPSRLITLESDVFNSCPLEEIKLPATLSTIGSSALNCSTLRKIICQQATPQALNSDPFSNVDKTVCELSVPAWSVDMYKLAKYWMNFSNITTYEANVDYLPISGIFTMADGIRPQGLPSVTVQQGATLIVRGDQPFATNQLVMNHKLYNSYSSFNSCVFSNLINESPAMTAESVAMSLNVNGNRWFFLSFPYDINYSDITIDEGKFFVFRKYDGASRAEKGTSTVTGDSWKNIEPTETLKAGNGYIFQCSADVTNLVLKATMESKNQLFANTMRAIALNDHIPADGNAENQSWNLVGNPFPSYFNMNNIEYVTPITIWNGSSYEALSPVDDEYYLRPFEAFFVQKPTDVASIKFNPDGRAYPTNASNKVAPKKAVTNSDRKVFNFVISNGNNTDKCRIVLNPKAKADYEMTCDAAKFMSLDADVPQIYTVDRKGTTFAINERPEGKVMMGMYAGNAGSYTISLQTQVEGVNVFLLDRTTGEETDLTTQDYTFNAPEGMDINRFEVRFETPGATGIDAENAVPVKVSVVKGALNVQAAAGSTIEVIDYAGLTVKRVNTTDTVTEIVLPQGAYIVVVNGKSYKAMLL